MQTVYHMAAVPHPARQGEGERERQSIHSWAVGLKWLNLMSALYEGVMVFGRSIVGVVMM